MKDLYKILFQIKKHFYKDLSIVYGEDYLGSVLCYQCFKLRRPSTKDDSKSEQPSLSMDGDQIENIL